MIVSVLFGVTGLLLACGVELCRWQGIARSLGDQLLWCVTVACTVCLSVASLAALLATV
jgi:hypothetical protein